MYDYTTSGHTDLYYIYSLVLLSAKTKAVPYVGVYTNVDYVSVFNIGYTGVPDCLAELRRKVWT